MCEHQWCQLVLIIFARSASDHLEAFGCAVDVLRCVSHSRRRVVMQETLFPDLPAGGVCEFGDRSVQKSDWGSRLVVLCDPTHRLLKLHR